MNLFTITLFIVLLGIGHAWQRGGLNATDPAHPGKCVIRGLILNPGETGSPEGECVRIGCRNEKGDYITEGCGTYGTDPPCKVGGSKYPNEPYPKCCEVEYICPEGVKPTNIWGIM